MRHSTRHQSGVNSTGGNSTQERDSSYEPNTLSTRFWIMIILFVFVVSSLGGYLLGILNSPQFKTAQDPNTDLWKQINPPEGYSVNARFGSIGQQLIGAGAFTLEDFANVYQRAGRPLTEDQLQILTSKSNSKVTFSQENAYFLLNFFWALGLTNKNPILENGPIMRGGRESIGRYASTGGWTLAARPVEELFSSTTIIQLSADQQKRLEEVALQVFRPCCDNPTHFPDCNHGMAMLGLLELLASQDVSIEEMFEAAKYANAYWFPSQTLVLAAFFKTEQQTEFAKVEARKLVSETFSSLSGYKNVNQWITSNAQLPQIPKDGSNCGV